MTTSKRKHSVHIHAPVHQVFQYIEGPGRTYDALGGGVQVSDEEHTDSGIGSTWKWSAPMFGIQMSGTMTRIDQVVDARIVDKSSTGPVWIWTLEPVHHDATELTLEMDLSEPLLLDKVMMMTVGRHTDDDMQRMLTSVKLAVES